MKLNFVITNAKASYVSKEDSICLFIVAKEAALNEQQIKPCVPLAPVNFNRCGLSTTVLGLLSCLRRVCFQGGLPHLVFTSW